MSNGMGSGLGGGMESGLGGGVAELVTPVSPDMLDGSRLVRNKSQPALAWVFRGESFWIEREEAAAIPTKLAQAILGPAPETSWIRGKWSLSEDGATLTLTEITATGRMAAEVATIPVGLAAFRQITLAGDLFSMEKDVATDAPIFESHQPVAFQERSASPPLWGYRDPATGEVLIPAIYERAWDFSERGIGCVRDGEEYIVNARGERLVQPLWIGSAPDPFREGLARYINDRGQMGYFNALGEIVIPGQWTWVEPFSNGLALVNNGGSRQGEKRRRGDHWRAMGRDQ